MGQTKQLLPWESMSGSLPLVAAAFDAIADVCQEMVVVLGHEVEATTEALGDRKFHRAVSDPDAEMFQSLRFGLETARGMDPLADVLLHPGDHPAVERKTLDSLIRVGDGHRQCAIMPVYRGKGGHPVLIPATIIDQILVYDGHGGLRQFWTEHPQSCLRLVVSDGAVVQDVDTPADYRSSPHSKRGHRISDQ
jgi:molybdenum cofactor cytidylyltransferase